MLGDAFTTAGIAAMERGLVSDPVARWAIRRLCAARLRSLRSQGEPAESLRALAEKCCSSPIAPEPAAANAQHYELPASFFVQVLGRHRKYSCCWWPAGVETLDEAEEAALAVTCERAGIVDGMHVLDLGCGWGALSLWIARRYPNCRLLAVSNSASQRQFIRGEARRLGLEAGGRLRVVTADINQFEPGESFDRVVSIEMFEHLRNYAELLRRIATWLTPRGRLFVHIFCHHELAYEFETDGATNWMGRHFFTGGLMPAVRFLDAFQADMRTTEHWSWNGHHYQRTADAWLANLDACRDRILPILAGTYGPSAARRWFHRWRTFFLAVSELFGYAGGEEWQVAHLLLEPVRIPRGRALDRHQVSDADESAADHETGRPPIGVRHGVRIVNGSRPSR